MQRNLSLPLGRGTGTAMAAPLTRMLFFVQVSQNATCDAYSILILPVPPPVLFASVRAHACRFRPVFCRRYRIKLLRLFAFYFLLLLVFGDVEMNPGPDDSVLKQVLDGQKEIKEKLAAIEKNQAESNSAISDLNELERAHRLGRHNPNKKRPIMVKFFSFQEKQAVLSSARKLKGSDISISEDFSESVRKKRKRLWDCAKANQGKTDKVNIKFTILYIKKVKYVYDESLD
ncbi:uncharacterized protein LOC125942658 [Dermacentor silvarum]|uniref:uncharacterized protein LOC125942658 n=1 Tax=Dermacentor silvarum TaxID=543639 RepID=UPI0021012D2A|nr:uncharacterized protein LOC125942658 [Dermacentor silvarum]